MSYDGGEVLQGLEEEWTFMGANLMEWASGMMVFLIIGSVSSSTVRAMPFMIVGFISTAMTLASLRKIYPDEHRGVRNMLTSSLGFPPMDIPLPASLQPVWSSSPIRELPEKCAFVKLGLEEVFASPPTDSEADGEFATEGA